MLFANVCIQNVLWMYIFCVEGLYGKVLGNLKGEGEIFMEGEKDFPK